MSVRIKRDQNKSYHVAELAERDNSFTPDFLDRKLEKYIPVFVYGTLKAGGRFHGILEGAPSFGDAYTATGGYTMNGTSSDFPVVFSHSKVEAGMAPVYGEVYIINAAMLLELDRIEGNNEMYCREQRWVFLCDQSIEGKGGLLRPAIKCWIYLGVSNFWDGIPTTQIKKKKMGDREVWDWPLHHSLSYKQAHTYPPTPANTQTTQKAVYKPEHAAWMWEGFSEVSDDRDTVDWDKYDEMMAEKADQQVPWTI